MKRRGRTAQIGVTLASAAAVSCTLIRSLDYLQSGDAPPDGGVDAEGGPPPTEGGLRTPTVIVPNQTKPRLLAQDTAALYWVSGTAVMTIAKSGGAARPLGPAGGALHLAVDPEPNGAVYLATGGEVVRLPKDGSAGGAIFKTVVGSPAATTVAADESYVFVLQYEDNQNAASKIVRMAKDGGGQTAIDPTTEPTTLTIDAKSVVWTDMMTSTTPFFGERSKTAVDGTASTVFPLGVNDEPPLASANVVIDDANIFWANDVGLASRKREKGAPVILLYRSTTDALVGAVAHDATSLYVIEKAGNSILRFAKRGGGPETLISGLRSANALVLDGTSVYITVEATGSEGALLKVAK